MKSEDVIVSFGKYRGKTLGEIAAADMLYLDWLNGRDLRPPLLEAVADLCERFGHEIDAELATRQEG